MSLSIFSSLALCSRVHFYLAVCCVALALPSLTLAEARDCKNLRATGNAEYPPYLFRESETSNDLLGANAQIMALLAEKLGVKIEVVYTGPWSRAQKEVRDGRFDLLAGAFFTVPRAQYMDYVYPAFLTTKSVVWINKEKPFEYQRREDLIGRAGATVIHNSFGEEFDEFAKANLDLNGVASLQQAFNMLVLGRVDYLLYENSPAEAYSRTWGVNDKVRVAGDGISAEGLYLTLSHRSACNTGELRGKLTKALREIVENGQAESALQSGLALWQKRNPQTNTPE